VTTTQERPTRPPSRESRHGPIAQLLIAWSPLSVILVAYAAAGWVAEPIGVDGAGPHVNRLGLPLHVAAPARVDHWLFGAVPSVWLQARLVDGSAHWYDAVAALVYLTHFVAIPLVTALVWFAVRDRFAAWLVAVLTFTALGVGGYVAFPSAPPWMASEVGVVGPVHRISGLGLEYLHLAPLDLVVTSGQASSNPVAAMPSMHAGSAMLVCLFLWPVAGRVWRAALGLYVCIMALSLVYTGEHYVADVVAGWAVAGVAVAAGRLATRPSPTRH
jgi:hypothetical protein